MELEANQGKGRNKCRKGMSKRKEEGLNTEC
jgi:hypothetical protein